MMRKKGNKGISLIAMILTVIVLFIIIGTISFSSRNSYNMNKIKNFYTDIETVQEAVSVYYIKNKELPYFYVLNTGFDQYRPLAFTQISSDSDSNDKDNRNNELYIFSETLKTRIPDAKFGENDNQYYYALDTRKLGNLTLNNANNIEQMNFDEIKKSGNSLVETANVVRSLFDEGFYIVNERSHKVYYTNPISVEGVKYYSTEDSGDDIYLVTSEAEKNKGIEDIILDTEKENMLESYYEIIYHANGGINAPTNYKIAQNEVTTEEKTYIIWDWKAKNVTEPIRTGMTFVGWSSTSDEIITKNDIETGKVTDADIEAIKNNTKFKITDGKYVELYAVWKENSDLDLEYYYPDSTGGVMLSEQANKYSREPLGNKVKNVKNNELYERPVCFDCPVSGYKVEWIGGTKLTYIAESLTSEIDLIGTEEIENNAFSVEKRGSENFCTYIVTEPGTFQLEGKFRDLHITVDDANGNSQEVTLFTSANTFNMYQTQSNKTIFDDKFKIGVTILSGKDGKFLIPKLATAYLGLGIKLPNDNLISNSEFSIDYSADDETVPYYIKSFVQKLNSSSCQEFELGTVIDISDTNTDKYKIIFGCRNYGILNSNDSEAEIIYEENLQNAYEVMSNLNYNTIKVLRNVNFGGASNNHSWDDVYKLSYDSSGLDNVSFYRNNNFSIDFNNYKIERRGSIIGSYVTVLLTNNSKNLNKTSGFYFSPNTLADKTDGALSVMNLTIDNNVNVKLSEANAKNSDGIDIERHAISAGSSLYLLNAYINSDSSRLSTVFGGMRTGIYLGDANNKIVEINNTNYYGLETTGLAYWYSSVAKIETKNVDYSECYRFNGYNKDFIYYPAETRKVCIYEGTNKYYASLGDHVWYWQKNNNNYYFSTLQEANDSVDSGATLKRIRTEQSAYNGGDTATLTKNLNLDFDNNKQGESIQIYINGNIEVNIENCNIKYSGMPIYVNNSNAKVLLNNCNIEGTGAGVKNYGILNINSSTITGTTDGIQNHKELVIENSTIIGKNDDAIENSGNLTILSGNVTGMYGINGTAGTITLGNSESETQNVNSNSPTISGKRNGFYSGNLKFYDGKIISDAGSDTALRKVTVQDKAYGYMVRKKIENKKEIAYLDYGAEFDTGIAVNEKMKKIAGNSRTTWYDAEQNIKEIKRSNTIATKYKNDTYKVSTAESGSPIYMWYENEILYYYSDNTKIYLNKNADYMFATFKNLTNIDVTKFDVSYTTSMMAMFYYCSNLNALNLSTWNTSNVTDMSNMFSACRRLTSLDLSRLDTSKVTNMSYMFSDCMILKTLNVRRINTSQVTDMSGMFRGCSLLKVLDLSNFNTSKVTNMYSMFENCRSLTELDLRNFDVRNVENVDYMFAFSKKIENLEFSNWNTSKIKTASCFMYDLENVTAEITIRSKINSYEYMFENAANQKGQVIVNYTSATESLVDQLIETKGSGNVIKGNLVY